MICRQDGSSRILDVSEWQRRDGNKPEVREQNYCSPMNDEKEMIMNLESISAINLIG